MRNKYIHSRTHVNVRKDNKSSGRDIYIYGSVTRSIRHPRKKLTDHVFMTCCEHIFQTIVLMIKQLRIRFRL